MNEVVAWHGRLDIRREFRFLRVMSVINYDLPRLSFYGFPQAPHAVVRFGVFEADLRAGELRRNGVRVRLQDLPFRALTLLLAVKGK